jgi:hypothetical protein
MTKIIELTSNNLNQALSIKATNTPEFSNAIRFAALLKAAVALVNSQSDLTDVESNKQTNVGKICEKLTKASEKIANEAQKAYEEFKKEVKEINKLNKTMFWVGVSLAAVSLCMMAFVGPGALIMAAALFAMTTIPMKTSKNKDGIEERQTMIDELTNKIGGTQTEKGFIKLGLIIGMSVAAGSVGGAIDGGLAVGCSTEEAVAETTEDVTEEMAEEMTEEATTAANKTPLKETDEKIFLPAFKKSFYTISSYYFGSLFAAMNPTENFCKAGHASDKQTLWITTTVNIAVIISTMLIAGKCASMQSETPALSSSGSGMRMVLKMLAASTIGLQLSQAVLKYETGQSYKNIEKSMNKQAECQKMTTYQNGVKALVQTLEDDMSQAYQQLSAGSKSQTEGFSQWFGEDQAMANILGRFN